MGMTVTLTMLKNASFDIFKHCSEKKCAMSTGEISTACIRNLDSRLLLQKYSFKFLTHSDLRRPYSFYAFYLYVGYTSHNLFETS